MDVLVSQRLQTWKHMSLIQRHMVYQVEQEIVSKHKGVNALSFIKNDQRESSQWAFAPLLTQILHPCETSFVTPLVGVLCVMLCLPGSVLDDFGFLLSEGVNLHLICPEWALRQAWRLRCSFLHSSLLHGDRSVGSHGQCYCLQGTLIHFSCWTGKWRVVLFCLFLFW